MKRLAQLFWELFKISLFVIGGGYAIIAVADGVFAKRKWTDEGELLDNLPVFQMVPGLIATHTAVYVGRKVAGGLGAVVGVLGVALPSVGIFTLVALGYDALPLDHPYLRAAFVGLRSALTGVIAATVIRSWSRNLRDVFSYAVMCGASVALVCGIGVPWVLLAAMAVGLGREASSGGSRRFCASWLPLLLFLKYGALCFGGGFVLVPMYLEDFVGPSAGFLNVTAEEFSNLMALTQMTPGPIGVNGATYFGFRLAGVAGAVLASAALLLPGSALAYLAFASLDRFQTSRIVRGILRGVKPASLALMLVALWAFAGLCIVDAEKSVDPLALALAALATYLSFAKKLNPVLLIVASAVVAFLARGMGGL